MPKLCISCQSLLMFGTALRSGHFGHDEGLGCPWSTYCWIGYRWLASAHWWSFHHFSHCVPLSLFLSHRYNSKRKAFTKTSKKWQDDLGRKNIERNFQKLTKYCKVIRVICHTQVWFPLCQNVWWSVGKFEWRYLNLPRVAWSCYLQLIPAMVS